MPKPTDEYWVRRIHDIVGVDERKSIAKIEEQLEQEEAKKFSPRTDIPRGNTIRRIRDRFPKSERVTYRPVAWPESFGNPDLPWESGAAIFELWRHLRGRPSLRVARAYWRVTLAAPAASVPARHGMAAHLLNYDPREVEMAILSTDFVRFEKEAAMFPASLEDMESGVAVGKMEEIHGEQTPERRDMWRKAFAAAADFYRWREGQDDE